MLNKISVKWREALSGGASGLGGGGALAGVDRNGQIKDILKLKSTLKKLDESRQGHLSQAQFAHLLATSRIALTDEDMFVLMETFDPHLSDKFQYNSFIRSMIELTLL